MSDDTAKFIDFSNRLIGAVSNALAPVVNFFRKVTGVIQSDPKLMSHYTEYRYKKHQWLYRHSRRMDHRKNRSQRKNWQRWKRRRR